MVANEKGLERYVFLAKPTGATCSLWTLSTGNCFEKSLGGKQTPDVPKHTSELCARIWSGFCKEGRESESLCFTRKKMITSNNSFLKKWLGQVAGETFSIQ